MTNAHIQTTKIGELTVAHEWIGSPSPHPVVFLHGLGDSAIITFRPFAIELAQSSVSSLLVDLPGFGFSTAPASWSATTEDQAEVVATLLDRLDISRTVVVAHSMGGSVAILLAEAWPVLVSRLIVAEPLLLPEQSALGRSVAKRTEGWFVDRGFAMLQLATQRQAGRGDLAARSFQEPLSHANPAIMHRSATSLLRKRSPSFQRRLARLPIPRTLMIGERTVTGTDSLEASGVMVERIPNAGHSMMSENPAAFLQAIRKALSS